MIVFVDPTAGVIKIHDDPNLVLRWRAQSPSALDPLRRAAHRLRRGQPLDPFARGWAQVIFKHGGVLLFLLF
jgi:hypothetical protein